MEEGEREARLRLGERKRLWSAWSDQLAFRPVPARAVLNLILICWKSTHQNNDALLVRLGLRLICWLLILISICGSLVGALSEDLRRALASSNSISACLPLARPQIDCSATFYRSGRPVSDLSLPRVDRPASLRLLRIDRPAWAEFCFVLAALSRLSLPSADALSPAPTLLRHGISTAASR